MAEAGKMSWSVPEELTHTGRVLAIAPTSISCVFATASS